MSRSRFFAASLLALSLAATGCQLAINQAEVRDNASGKRRMDVLRLPVDYPELRYMQDAALLSAVASDKPDAPQAKSFAEYCSVDESRYDPSADGWKEDLDLPQVKAVDGDRIVPGLRYRVWYNEQEKLAVLSYRGTQSSGDWFANLRWVTRAVPHTRDHYEQAEPLVEEIIGEIKKRHGDGTTIVATGHSLGGGLAQMAGYASNGAIKTVYAFDPSVVTYYYSIPKDIRETSRNGLTVFRIAERGEPLAYLRWILKRLYPVTAPPPRIVQVKVHRFDVSGVIAKHSIRRFACSPPQPAAAQAAAVLP